MSARRCIVYIATSLDGYIARADRSISWLFTDGDFGYNDFIKTIGTILMGRKTYQDCLGFGEWAYKYQENYILTTNNTLSPPPDAPHVKFHNGNTGELVKRLKTEKVPGNIWLIGGTQLVTEAMQAGQVDELIVSVHPIVLGGGIPLFFNVPETNLELIGTKPFPQGLVQLSYRIKH